MKPAKVVCPGALAKHGAGWLNTEETHAILAETSADETANQATARDFPMLVKLAS